MNPPQAPGPKTEDMLSRIRPLLMEEMPRLERAIDQKPILSPKKRLPHYNLNQFIKDGVALASVVIQAADLAHSEMVGLLARATSGPTFYHSDNDERLYHNCAAYVFSKALADLALRSGGAAPHLSGPTELILPSGLKLLLRIEPATKESKSIASGNGSNGGSDGVAFGSICLYTTFLDGVVLLPPSARSDGWAGTMMGTLMHELAHVYQGVWWRTNHQSYTVDHKARDGGYWRARRELHSYALGSTAALCMYGLPLEVAPHMSRHPESATFFYHNALSNPEYLRHKPEWTRVAAIHNRFERRFFRKLEASEDFKAFRNCINTPESMRKWCAGLAPFAKQPR